MFLSEKKIQKEKQKQKPHSPSLNGDFEETAFQKENSYTLHTQLRELCILFSLVQIDAKMKWHQSPPAEKGHDTLLWKCAELVTPEVTLPSRAASTVQLREKSISEVTQT